MMDFVVDPKLVVAARVILYGFVDIFFLQLVNHLDSVEVDECSSGGSAGYVLNHIGLDGHLNFLNSLLEGNHEVNSRIA